MQLSKNKRDTIIRKATTEAFEKKKERLAVQANGVAKAVYRVAFTLKERKQLSGAPKGWFRTLNSIKFAVRNEIDDMPLGEELHFPYEYGGWNKPPVVDISTNEKLLARYEKHKKDERVLREQETEFRTKVRSIVYSVNTDIQLLKVWPKAKKYLPEHVRHYEVVPDSIVNDVDEILKEA